VYINVNSSLRIKGYTIILNYNNCSTDWSFPLRPKDMTILYMEVDTFSSRYHNYSSFHMSTFQSLKNYHLAFQWSSCFSISSFLDHWLSFCPISSGHCIYAFDYPFGIFTLFLRQSNYSLNPRPQNQRQAILWKSHLFIKKSFLVTDYA
jgi:hypothetical protein